MSEQYDNLFMAQFQNKSVKECVLVLFLMCLFHVSPSRQDNNVDSTSCLKETAKTEDPKQGN